MLTLIYPGYFELTGVPKAFPVAIRAGPMIIHDRTLPPRNEAELLNPTRRPTPRKAGVHLYGEGDQPGAKFDLKEML